MLLVEESAAALSMVNSHTQQSPTTAGAIHLSSIFNHMIMHFLIHYRPLPVGHIPAQKLRVLLLHVGIVFAYFEGIHEEEKPNSASFRLMVLAKISNNLTGIGRRPNRIAIDNKYIVLYTKERVRQALQCQKAKVDQLSRRI